MSTTHAIGATEGRAAYSDALLKSFEHDDMTVVIRYREPVCVMCGENERAAEAVCTLNGPGGEHCTTFIRYGICLPCVKRIDKLSPQEKDQVAESVVDFFEAWLKMADSPTGPRAQA